MSDAISEICAWARNIPGWEQETLRRILAGEEFNQRVYESLGGLLLSGTSAPPVDLTAFEAVAGEDSSEKTVLLSISEATNVNALVEKQRIDFSEGVTIVFGANASGKSGYARLFGSACFTRGDREVLPNFLNSAATGQPQRAIISIQKGGRSFQIEHNCSQPISELTLAFTFSIRPPFLRISRERML